MDDKHWKRERGRKRGTNERPYGCTGRSTVGMARASRHKDRWFDPPCRRNFFSKHLIPRQDRTELRLLNWKGCESKMLICRAISRLPFWNCFEYVVQYFYFFLFSIISTDFYFHFFESVDWTNLYTPFLVIFCIANEYILTHWLINNMKQNF